MTDVFTPDKRSQVMSRIRATGTQPEEKLYLMVRDLLGNRWRIDRNRTDLPGKPDLVVPSLKLAVFMDGCFFHKCPTHGRIPDKNHLYWKPKLEGNVRRDVANRRKLRKNGYSVWRVWEHGLKTIEAQGATLARLERDLANRKNAFRA